LASSQGLTVATTLFALFLFSNWPRELLALGGAELLVCPTAIGWLPAEKTELGAAQHCAWETVQRGHAVANGCYVAAVNRAGSHDGTEFWGQSFVANPYGEVIAKAAVDSEQVLLADLDFDTVENFRRIWPFFRDRRIDTYGGLLERWRMPDQGDHENAP
jgi:N-carbamoylputrescine amidase